MSKAFQKFIQKPESGAKKKERIRQEKKKVRQETKQYFEQKKQEARNFRAHGSGWKPEGGEQQPAPGGRKPEAGSKPYAARGTKPQYAKPEARVPDKEFKAKNTEAGNKKYGARGTKPEAEGRKLEVRSPKPEARNTTFEGKKFEAGSQRPAVRSQQTSTGKPAPRSPKPTPGNKKVEVKSTKHEPGKAEAKDQKAAAAQMPLNKFIAHAGICARRDAAELVRSGKVMVNQQLITDPGFKVTDRDEVKVNGKQITKRKNLVYILLNKPKDFITTTEDPQGRKTVLDIVKNATTERVYPIGRLDRNTTGVLLLTNDGELAQKLSHPSYEVKKIYEVTLDKPLAKKDFETIAKGVTLEDGFIAPDLLAYADPKNKSVIGVEIHSGRNRIVRRIFEALGYDVRNLDRVLYANLTKKNVDRGKWRFLNEKEVRLLKFLNASYTRK